MDWTSEIERMLSGYAFAIDVICEVVAEGTRDAAEQLRAHIMEVFDLYRAPLQVMSDRLSPDQQQELSDLDGKLLAADKEIRRVIDISLVDHLERIRGGTAQPKRRRKSAP